MPTGKSKCPVCNGQGTLTEDSKVYDFITRDPKTSKCLACNGEGYLNSRSKLPNGKDAYTIMRKEARRLNVSNKVSGANHKNEASNIGEYGNILPRSIRLSRVIASGRPFLVVTETDPYYMEVWMMIRKTERKQGTWSEEDEELYVAELEARFKAMKGGL